MLLPALANHQEALTLSPPALHDRGPAIQRRSRLGQTAFFSIRFMLWPMALVGLRPLGQTSTQFMML